MCLLFLLDLLSVGVFADLDGGSSASSNGLAQRINPLPQEHMHHHHLYGGLHPHPHSHSHQQAIQLQHQNWPAPRRFPLRVPLTKTIIKEGFLMKRGEHIRNWRRRYFILREDGSFYGYKMKPPNEKKLAEPLNNFTVRDCNIIQVSVNRSYLPLWRFY